MLGDTWVRKLRYNSNLDGAAGGRASIKITTELNTRARCSVLWKCEVGRFLAVEKFRDGFLEEVMLQDESWKGRWDTAVIACVKPRGWEERGYSRDGEKPRVGEPDARSSGLSPVTMMVLYLARKLAVFPTFSFYLLIQGLHYKDCVLGQDVHNP